MLPDNGNEVILFAAPEDLSFAQLQDFYGMENMPDTKDFLKFLALTGCQGMLIP